MLLGTEVLGLSEEVEDLLPSIESVGFVVQMFVVQCNNKALFGWKQDLRVREVQLLIYSMFVAVRQFSGGICP